MTHEGTTMTINIKVAIAKDLFVENNVFNLHSEGSTPRTLLSGAAWLTEGILPSEALPHLLKHVITLVNRLLSELDLWLLVGSSTWQPNTGAVRYHKISGALKARGLSVPVANQWLESEIFEHHGKVKFFGATKLENIEIADTATILLNERCTYLAALPMQFAFQDVLADGWTGDLASDVKFVDAFARRGAILIKQVGEFDDREQGVAVLGAPHIIEALVAERTEA